MKIAQTLVAALVTLLSTAAFAATDVNKASVAELEAVKGIGPAMASRIVDARKNGAFKDWGDLQTRVKGVRNGNAAKFSADGLTVNGAQFKLAAAGAGTARNAQMPKAAKPEKTDSAPKK